MNATEGEMHFIQVIATAIAPYLFEGGFDRADAAGACARLAGSIMAELIESGGAPWQSFPLALDDLNAKTVDEFDKFITGGGAFVQ